MKDLIKVNFLYSKNFNKILKLILIIYSVFYNFCQNINYYQSKFSNFFLALLNNTNFAFFVSNKFLLIKRISNDFSVFINLLLFIFLLIFIFLNLEKSFNKNLNYRNIFLYFFILVIFYFLLKNLFFLESIYIDLFVYFMLFSTAIFKKKYSFGLSNKNIKFIVLILFLCSFNLHILEYFVYNTYNYIPDNIFFLIVLSSLVIYFLSFKHRFVEFFIEFLRNKFTYYFLITLPIFFLQFKNSNYDYIHLFLPYDEFLSVHIGKKPLIDFVALYSNIFPYIINLFNFINNQIELIALLLSIVGYSCILLMIKIVNVFKNGQDFLLNNISLLIFSIFLIRPMYSIRIFFPVLFAYFLIIFIKKEKINNMIYITFLFLILWINLLNNLSFGFITFISFTLLLIFLFIDKKINLNILNYSILLNFFISLTIFLVSPEIFRNLIYPTLFFGLNSLSKGFGNGFTYLYLFYILIFSFLSFLLLNHKSKNNKNLYITIFLTIISLGFFTYYLSAPGYFHILPTILFFWMAVVSLNQEKEINFQIKPIFIGLFIPLTLISSQYVIYGLPNIFNKILHINEISFVDNEYLKEIFSYDSLDFDQYFKLKEIDKENEIVIVNWGNFYTYNFGYPTKSYETLITKFTFENICHLNLLNQNKKMLLDYRSAKIFKLNYENTNYCGYEYSLKKSSNFTELIFNPDI